MMYQYMDNGNYFTILYKIDKILDLYESRFYDTYKIVTIFVTN